MYISQTNKKHESIVMKKRSKYKPKGVRVNALTYVLDGLKPFSTSEHSTTLRIKNHAAMDALRRGDATVADLDILIAAFNMCEAYTMLRPELGADWKDEINAGLDALHAVGRRGIESKRFILKADELVAMNTVLEIHDAQLDNTTVQDMERAMDIVTKEYRAKRMRPIKQKEIA
jgi:hypothetical protein